MDIISLLVALIVFAVVAYGIWWVCAKFSMPPPVLWLCGGVLLIILLLFLAQQFGISTVLK
jgi:hypothetical protein